MSGFKFPTSCAILFGLITVGMTAIWLLPAGQHDQEINPAVGNEMPALGMYHHVERTPQATALITDIARGMDLDAGRTFDTLSSLWATFGAGAKVVYYGFLLLMTGLPVFVWIKCRYAERSAVGSASLAETATGTD